MTVIIVTPKVKITNPPIHTDANIALEQLGGKGNGCKPRALIAVENLRSTKSKGHLQRLQAEACCQCVGQLPTQDKTAVPIIWQFEETTTNFRCLIRDNDSKYTDAFDTVFESQAIHIVPTPIQAPNANSYFERWIRTVREECLDYILVINEAHLRRMLKEFIDYYNCRRPHQGLDQQSPVPCAEPATTGKVERRQVLGGIVNDYYRVPTTTAVCLA